MCLAIIRSKLFDTLIVFLKEFGEKINLKKKISRQKREKLPSMQRVFKVLNFQYGIFPWVKDFRIFT